MAKRRQVIRNRNYTPKAKLVTTSYFGEHAHRWPQAGEPMADAMACVEVVANCSPHGGKL